MTLRLSFLILISWGFLSIQAQNSCAEWREDLEENGTCPGKFAMELCCYHSVP